jgi:hypothetical protein
MKSFQLLSRRNSAEGKTDFRPEDPNGSSPFAQLRRLSAVLEQPSPPADDYTNMDDALDAYREYLYRKIFSGTTHDEFEALDNKDPQRLDWLLAVATVDAEHFRNSKKSN